MSLTPPRSSGSTKQSSYELEDNGFELPNVKFEEAEEIARLEINTPKTNEEIKAIDDRIPTIPFTCSNCSMHEMVHYYGSIPPFAQGVKFLEDTYVMRDPFQAPPPRWKSKAEYYIALGSKCRDCESVVCKDPTCSYYYTSTYCLECAKSHMKKLPVEAQVKLRKQLALAEAAKK